MMELTPSFLLDNPELVTPLAPWCVILDNLELGTLLLAQPWLAGDGLRRADLERQLAHLAAELPLGPVYFQRVKRAVAHLEEIGAMAGSGSGRTRRFVVTPPGFAALILNLSVLRTDPTIDGSEFELKRALVAMWSLVLQRLEELPGEPLEESLIDEEFLDQVEQLTVLGRQVINDRLVGEALDILGLVATQRHQVTSRLLAARRRLEQVAAQAGALRSVDLSRLAASGLAEAAALLSDAGTRAMVLGMASSLLPQLSLRATVLRYEQYLHYLDELATLYAGELKTVDLAAVRGILVRRRA